MTVPMYIRGFANFEITVACGLKFYWYLRILSLKFQKARTNIEVQSWTEFNFRLVLENYVLVYG